MAASGQARVRFLTETGQEVTLRRFWMRVGKIWRAAAVAMVLSLGILTGGAGAAIASPSVTLTPDTVGLTFVSETTAADGTVTDTWTDSSGDQIQYVGPPGAQLQESLTYSASTGYELDMSATSVDGSVTAHWCTKLKNSSVHISACNIRTALYSAPGNHVIAENLSSQAQASGGLTYDSVWLGYNWTGNQVLTTDPLGDLGTHCNPWTLGVTWYGVSISGTEQYCDGTLHPWGQAQAKGGGIWQASSGTATTAEIGVATFLKTSAPSNTNPLSTLHLRAFWN